MTSLAHTTAISRRSSALLWLLFFGSGCAALLYEVVWFHLLRLVIGASVISLGVLLATFMGGMGIGSLLLPRCVSPRRHPLAIYALCELLIAICAIALPLVLPALAEIYVARVDPSSGGLPWRAALSALCLLPPTILMGATLPAVARWVQRTPAGVAELGSFYAANLIGAVAGTLVAGFYLLRVHDVYVATAAGVGLNLLVAGLAYAYARRHPHALEPAETPHAPRSAEVPHGAAPWSIAAVLALSGAASMGAQVVWTRWLGLLLGATTYTFTLVLAVFLTALGLGSSIGSALARRTTHARHALWLSQLLAALALAFTAHALLEVLPYTQPKEVFLPAVREQLGWMYTWDFVRCFAAIALGPLCWGAAFPLGVAALAGGGQRPDHAVARACATNTFGAIVGTAVVSFYAIAEHGTRAAAQGLVVASALAAALGLHAALDRRAGARFAAPGAILAALLVLASGVLLAWRGLPEVPAGLLAYGRRVERWNDGARVLHVREGHSTAVAVTEQDDGARNFHVSGKIVASAIPIDMRLQRLLGHIPALLHPQPRSVLIVGCGAGVTAGCFVDHPSIERIVICEIEPVVPDAARAYFDAENRGVLRDPRTQVIRDDARHFLATSRERFDILTSDPIHPWVAGAAALYTAEYYQLCLAHLAPGGIFTQWVPLYETSEAAVKSELRTFFDAFPEGSIWSSDPEELGYDVVMLGSREPLRIDADALEERLSRAPEAWTSLEELGLASAQALLETYAGRGPDLRPWLADAEPNLDRSLRLQYLAGASLERQDGDKIFSAMLHHRRYPEAMLMPKPYCEAELRARFDRAKR